MRFFSWGPNSCGQLGQGTTAEECREPVEVKMKDVSMDRIVCMSGGANHSFLLSDDGSLWFAGKDDVVNGGDVVPNFEKLDQFDGLRLSKVATMWNTSLALTADGQCFGWGSNSFGQLGLPEKQILDIKLLTKDKVKDIAVGLRHCLILKEDGTIISAGSGKCGQLGRDDNRIGFHPVDRLKDVVNICCGMNHSLAVTKEGKLYSWGANKFGQLGLDPAVHENSKYPVEVELPVPASEILNSKLMSGWTHSAVLSKCGKLINWGRNNYGQLGDSSGAVRWRPKILPGYNFNDVISGAEHNLGLVENTLWTWGWNEHGSCTFDKDNVLEPSKVNLKDIVKIGVGASQSFALTL
ncbi:secretion-regulating guanine nucleotide exchange factor-like [Cimex lectularius]|uniref:RCC1-like domain-containing protein n=1 Tax=Cimex lectularius TaxID=79782 RepID=A0A8I6RNS6_CIMLE|nr:secretion-regulating guanine nucleotide exchange factor-like [Cimex lectularius]